MKQCSALIVNRGPQGLYRQSLERIGFNVAETSEWPDDDAVATVQVVVVLLSQMRGVAMLAARMRAKPRFGQRVLIAVVPPTAAAEDRRSAISGGFDDVVSESKDARPLVASVLRLLRLRPQHRCLLQDRKRRAA